MCKTLCTKGLYQIPSIYIYPFSCRHPLSHWALAFLYRGLLIVFWFKVSSSAHFVAFVYISWLEWMSGHVQSSYCIRERVGSTAWTTNPVISWWIKHISNCSANPLKFSWWTWLSDFAGFVVQFRKCLNHQKVNWLAAKSIWNLQLLQSGSPWEFDWIGGAVENVFCSPGFDWICGAI